MKNIYLLIGGIIFVLASVFLLTDILSYFTKLPPPNVAGEFGDQFGVLNTLFTGLAFVVVIITLRQQAEQIRLQRQDLQNQKEDLKLQREEMQRQCAEQKRQADEFGAPNRLMKIQQFDSFFYNYFNQIYKFKEGVNEIKINNNGFKDKLIHLVYGILYDVYNHSADKALDDLSMDLIKGMIANMRFWGDSLYMCFQYILDNNYLDDEQKMFYLRILSNSLDSTENKIIYFYGLFCKYYNIAEELNKNGILYKDRVIEQFSIDSTLDSLRNNMDVERNVWLQNGQPTQKNTM
mgnify:CR=1 FL=1